MHPEVEPFLQDEAHDRTVRLLGGEVMHRAVCAGAVSGSDLYVVAMVHASRDWVKKNFPAARFYQDHNSLALAADALCTTPAALRDRYERIEGRFRAFCEAWQDSSLAANRRAWHSRY